MGWHEDHEDLLLIIMVFLLMMLSVVIWVAFCVAVKKTARKFIELKRQRRREVYDTDQALPTYAQALEMSSTPSPNPALSNSNDRVPPYKAHPKPSRVLRVAPDRPGSLPTIVLPPSYDSAVSRAESSTPVYTISGSIGHTSF